MEMIFVHWQVTKAVNLGENLITRGGSKAMPEQQRSGFSLQSGRSTSEHQ